MTDAGFKDHFSAQAAGYAAYRPTYPAGLADALAGISPAQGRALDCGCGTGQLSVLLARRFAEVIATDASSAQIENAERHPQVRYLTAAAESSGLPAASVDLITAAQAAHWFDLTRFYAEVFRIARTGTAVALITYGVLHVEGRVDDVVQRFYYDVIGPYWPAERRHVENGYRDLPFPFRETRLPPLAIETQWRLNDLLGYISTWSAVKAAGKAQGEALIHQFREDLRRDWGNPDMRRRITWPLSYRAGHV